VGRGDGYDGQLEGSDDLAPARSRSSNEKRIRIWIANQSYGADQHWPPLTEDEPTLLAEHGPCPDDSDPLAELPDGIETAGPDAQLVELFRVYGADVARGRGLTLAMLKTAENAGEWGLRGVAERMIERRMRASESDDPEAIAAELFSEYRAREAELHWACEKLGWPSEWVLESIRASVEKRYSDLAPGDQLAGHPDLSAVDLEREANLAAVHGEPPEGLNALIDLPDGIATATVDEQLQALNVAYGNLAREMAAFDELDEASFESDLANDLRLRLHIEAERSNESYEEATMRWMRLRQAEERHLYWACRELELPASAVISYLVDQVERDF